jgi:hypothetical protein
MKHTVALDYNSGIAKDTVAVTARGLKFSGDPDPKRPIHYDFQYKVIQVPGSASAAVRRIGASWQMNPSTLLAYNSTSHEERLDGTAGTVGSDSVKVTHKLFKKVDVIGQWQSRSDRGVNEHRSGFSFGGSGKLSDNEKLEFLYGVDKVTSSVGISSAINYKLKYDHMIDANNSVALSANITAWSGNHVVNPNLDAVLWQVEVKRLFD